MASGSNKRPDPGVKSEDEYRAAAGMGGRWMGTVECVRKLQQIIDICGDRELFEWRD